ncbi:hypothetical protein SKAU_G00009620 [Synaphobranchus kaupii]|uniref:Uncharacterized protein n=1 Tax=Synaphobranchus kaupii TaxID=118154 RepID=A0A9Q1GAY1_SYNKA|nr:hypothetical protein SKAU_G00009620 [Synaphobranchus kaupii]
MLHQPIPGETGSGKGRKKKKRQLARRAGNRDDERAAIRRAFPPGRREEKRRDAERELLAAQIRRQIKFSIGLRAERALDRGLRGQPSQPFPRRLLRLVQVCGDSGRLGGHRPQLRLAQTSLTAHLARPGHHKRQPIKLSPVPAERGVLTPVMNPAPGCCKLQWGPGKRGLGGGIGFGGELSVSEARGDPSSEPSRHGRHPGKMVEDSSAIGRPGDGSDSDCGRPILQWTSQSSSPTASGLPYVFVPTSPFVTWVTMN